MLKLVAPNGIQLLTDSKTQKRWHDNNLTCLDHSFSIHFNYFLKDNVIDTEKCKANENTIAASEMSRKEFNIWIRQENMAKTYRLFLYLV